MPVSASPPSSLRPTSNDGVRMVPLSPSATGRDPSIPVRTSQTSASDAAWLPDAERTASEDVRVKRASPLTASARPLPSTGRSTSLRTPAAPMLSERSAVSGVCPSGVTVTSPAPWPAAAHSDSRSLTVTPV